MGMRDRVRQFLQPVFQPGSAVAEGEAAPELGLADQDGRRWTLADLAGKPAVIYFYPKDDTPGCTKEACAFRDQYAGIRDRAALVGVSRDHADSHKAFAQKFNLPFPLLADVDGGVTRAWGVEGGLLMGRLPRRVTFVVDGRGRIARVFDPVKVEGHEREVLEAVGRLSG